MNSATGFGKRNKRPRSADIAQRDEIRELPQSKKALLKSRPLLIFAIASLLVSANHVWSMAGGKDLTRLLFVRSSDLSNFEFFEKGESYSNELSKLLGDRSQDRHQPSYEDAMRFANNLPNRFEEVARELAAASNRERPQNRDSSRSVKPNYRSSESHEANLAEILALRNNARTQFADVNRALAIKSSANQTGDQFSDQDQLMELLSVDWSALESGKRKQTIVNANRQTAVVFGKWLPLPTDYPQMELVSINPSGTALQFYYRLDTSQPELDLDEISNELSRSICDRELTRTIVRNGGSYDFVFRDFDDQIVEQFAVYEANCS